MFLKNVPNKTENARLRGKQEQGKTFDGTEYSEDGIF